MTDSERSRETGSQRRLPILLYPMATPVAAIVQLWAAAVVHPGLMVRSLFLAIVVSLVVVAVATLIAGERHRGALAAWAFLVGLTVDNLQASALLAAVGAAVLVAAAVQRGVPWRLGPLVSRAMAALGAILLIASLIRAVQVGAIEAAVDDLRRDLAHPAPAAAFTPSSPDIYVILLDGFPGASAGEREPTFDAAAFPDALRERGFDVAADSRSNYLITRLTLPSVFAASHLADVPGLHPSTIAKDATALRQLTEDGIALRLLGDAGYERIGVASGYSDLGPNRLDRQIVPPQIEEFEAAVLRTIGAGEILDVIAPDLGPSQKRQRVDDTFAALRAIATEPHERPRFVFVHVPAPHGPWVSTADGAPVAGASRLGEFNPAVTDIAAAQREFYGYATFVGRQTIEAIDAVLTTSDKDPVIALFSDHGPDVEFDSHDPLSSDLEERTSNLLAIRAPGHADVIPDDATPVNLFRYVLNPYLGTDLPLQPDTIWAWRTGSSILDYIEVDPATWAAK